MKNQFFYTRKVAVENPESPEIQEIKEFRDSFNIEKIIRTVKLGDKLVVLLDDLHERMQEISRVETNAKTGAKKQVMRREPQVFQTEIHLDGEDIERFYKVTSVD